MRLIRGAGLRGLGGIHPRIPVEDESAEVCGEIIRPLLSIRRRELRQYLNDIGQAWREDATNADDQFTRNRVRKLVRPSAGKRIQSVGGGESGRVIGDRARRRRLLGRRNLRLARNHRPLERTRLGTGIVERTESGSDRFAGRSAEATVFLSRRSGGRRSAIANRQRSLAGRKRIRQPHVATRRAHRRSAQAGEGHRRTYPGFRWSSSTWKRFCDSRKKTVAAKNCRSRRAGSLGASPTS